MKYRLTTEQYRRIKEEIDRRMTPDAFGETTIQSLYYDTDDFRIIRASIEKPAFKEKLRLRCYGINDTDKNVYLEMKRKADDVVYKRRIFCKEGDVPAMLSGNMPQSQIGAELDYFVRFYGRLSPKALILYDRQAFFDPNSDLRVTFDRNLRYRTDGFDLSLPLEGRLLLPEDSFLFEIKTSTSVPLWLCRLLGEMKIQKNSFSKYGEVYIREYCKKEVI